MSKTRKAFMWLYCFSKRLYKKPGFIITLLLIALLCGTLSFFSKEDNHMVRIAVYSKYSLPKDIHDALNDKSSCIGFEICNSKQQALEAVQNRGLDAAWIFDEPIQNAVQQYALKAQPIAVAFQREDTVFLRLAREKLYTLLYPHISREIYYSFMEEKFSETSKKDLDVFYNQNASQQPLVNVTLLNSDSTAQDLNYVLAPIRGLLGIAVFICAFCALIGFKKDVKGGLFARVPQNRLIYVEIICILIPSINAGVFVLLSLYISGLFTALTYELLYMAILILTSTALCTLLGEAAVKINALCAMLPIVSIAMLVLCPVFFNTNKAHELQLLMPPYYYLSALRNPLYLFYGFIFSICGFSLCVILKKLKYFLKKT